MGGSKVPANFADVINGSSLKEVKEGTESRLDLRVKVRERESLIER